MKDHLAKLGLVISGPGITVPFNTPSPGSIVFDPSEVTGLAFVSLIASRFVHPSWRPQNVMRAEDPGVRRAKVVGIEATGAQRGPGYDNLGKGVHLCIH